MPIFENVTTAPPRKLFTLLGVEWMATAYAWVSLPLYLLIGLVIAFILNRDQPLEARLWLGVFYSVLLHLGNVIHSIGHTLSSRWVGAPLDINLITATFYLTLYDDDSKHVSKWAHIGRALGGPLANLLVGLGTLAVWLATQIEWLGLFSVYNLATAAYLFLPIPSIDGGVLWKELFAKA